MNDTIKHKVTGKINHHTADPKDKALVFIFFPTSQFLKIILAIRQNSTIGFAQHNSLPVTKTKVPFFANPSINQMINSINL